MTTDTTLAAEGRRLLKAYEYAQRALRFSNPKWSSYDDALKKAGATGAALLSALEERDQLRSLLKEAGEIANFYAASDFNVDHGERARSLSTRIREALGSVARLRAEADNGQG